MFWQSKYSIYIYLELFSFCDCVISVMGVVVWYDSMCVLLGTNLYTNSAFYFLTTRHGILFVGCSVINENVDVISMRFRARTLPDPCHPSPIHCANRHQFVQRASWWFHSKRSLSRRPIRPWQRNQWRPWSRSFCSRPARPPYSPRGTRGDSCASPRQEQMSRR